MDQNHPQYQIVTLPAYRAVGMKWEGTYAEFSQLKQIIEKMAQRVDELEYAVQPDIQLGLSYHLRPDGFVHYSVYEVTDDQPLPAGMCEIHIPQMTYLLAHHQRGDNVVDTYLQIDKWLSQSEYKPYTEPGVQYYDSLPIKHERYPFDLQPDDPHFDILIPIELR